MRRSVASGMVALVALLGACTHRTQPTAATGADGRALASFAPTTPEDGGVEIARTTLLPGSTQASASSGQVADCFGPGVGVQVGGTQGEARFLFDAEGNPCAVADVLFDGRGGTGARAADPTISLTFHDSLGLVPEGPTSPLRPLKALPRIEVTSELLQSGQVAAATSVGAVQEDPLLSTLAAWQATDGAYATRSKEADAAASRRLQALVNGSTAESQAREATRLAAGLRERERQIGEERRRLNDLLAKSESSRAATRAQLEDWKQQESQLQSELAAAKARATQFEQLATRLQSQKAQAAKGYEEKIETLTTGLKTATLQADESRRQLILEAAAKIAEAQQLAMAASLQEQDIKLAEAARLKAEASKLMDDVSAMRAGEEVEPKAGPAAPLALSAVPVVVHAKNQTLEDILQNVLLQAQPQAGTWRSDWQLPAKAQFLLTEKWSLTAEAPVAEVLAQLQAQVLQNHNIALSFQQFAQSRLLVITAPE